LPPLCSGHAVWLRGLFRAAKAAFRVEIPLVRRFFSGLIIVVKATLELPEALLREAEKAATRNGLPLGVFVADAIQSKLGSDSGRSIKPWEKHFGALRHLHEESARIDQLVAEEFRTVDPENWR
jgi:hypothetical protein